MRPKPRDDLEVFLTEREVLASVPFSRQHLYKLEEIGQFPKRRQIGERRVAWLKSEISAWIEERLRIPQKSS